MVQDCLALFSEAADRGVDYKHWLTDPVMKAMLKRVFKKEMVVKGVVCALRR